MPFIPWFYTEKVSPVPYADGNCARLATPATMNFMLVERTEGRKPKAKNMVSPFLESQEAQRGKSSVPLTPYTVTPSKNGVPQCQVQAMSASAVWLGVRQQMPRGAPALAQGLAFRDHLAWEHGSEQIQGQNPS